MENPQVKARNMIVEVEDKVAGTVKIAGNPIKMTNIPEENRRNPAPEIGEHNDLVYTGWLGLSGDKLDDLRREGVI
jgi:crotonobetainyl-CoA:carnitine CoA-transferase CaiB-like acyl-CoA transferase